jgi:hypothetical protein
MTYEQLKAAIADHLDRDDLNGYIDQFIKIAESAHRRDVRIREMLVREPIAITGRYVPLPAGVLEVMSLRVSGARSVVVQEVSIHEIVNVRQEIARVPSFFCIYGAEIEFDVQPDAGTTGEIVYYKELTPLSASNASNALIEVAPDVYLYGALAASAPFLMNDERLQIWGGLYASAVEGLERTRIASRRVGPLVSRVSGRTP